MSAMAAGFGIASTIMFSTVKSVLHRAMFLFQEEEDDGIIRQQR
jgi:hypothetical protein